MDLPTNSIRYFEDVKGLNNLTYAFNNQEKINTYINWRLQ